MVNENQSIMTFKNYMKYFADIDSRFVAQKYSRSHIEVHIDFPKFKSLASNVIKILKFYEFDFGLLIKTPFLLLALLKIWNMPLKILQKEIGAFN